MKAIRRSQRLIPLVAAALATASAAHAEEKKVERKSEYVPEEPSKPKEEKKQGWDWRLGTGATVNFSDNRSVVGQTDGYSLTMGYKFDAQVDWRGDGHEVRNALNAAAGITRTPAVEKFIKSHDTLALSSIYLYHALPWIGPYAKVDASTATMPGNDYRDGPTTYAIAHTDGTTEPRITNQLLLTESFRPFKLDESIGLFLLPVGKEEISLEFRAGGGAKQIFADGQLAVDDDDDTDAVEVKELKDVYQVGAEAVLELWGVLYEKRFTYRASAGTMFPFWNNSDDDRGIDELTNLGFKAALSVKVVEWASLDYEFRAIREPQLIEDFQIQNTLLLSFGMTAGNQKEK